MRTVVSVPYGDGSMWLVVGDVMSLTWHCVWRGGCGR